jgi:dienelactone hydrolase
VKEEVMKRWILGVMAALVVFLAFSRSGVAQPRIVTRTVEYTVAGVPMRSYLAYDESKKEKRPGVLVVPEWWGLNDYAKRRARMIAELGYAALAVDMYGDGKVVTEPQEAAGLSGDIGKSPETGRARFIAAMEFLKREPTVDPARIAAIGYCFGGTVVLNMAAQGVDLAGVVSFHGGLGGVKTGQPGPVRAKVLVLHGADDKMVTQEQIDNFNKGMKTAGAQVTLISYPGALHSFTNPEATELGKKFNMPIAYNADADKKSWEEMTRFLKTVFA